jgi:lipoic acid synthetase
MQATDKQRGAAKMLRIPIHIENNMNPLKKPDWIRVRANTSPVVDDLKAILRNNKLHTVCEEASCPNLPECFGKGTATFMIMGDKCTRRCSFCDVGHGRPDPLDPEEPLNLARTIAAMNLKYVVVTSVDRDDLRDGGGKHFADCITCIRQLSPTIKIEILVPDFRGRMNAALTAFDLAQPDVFNHNIETVPRIYKQARPGSDYSFSLQLLQEFKKKFPHIPTKSGLMLGLGETNEEVIEVMKDLRAHQVDRLTLGQYLAPSQHHIRLQRYVHPHEFNMLAEVAQQLGFENVASGPMVRSSYHADLQAAGQKIS